MSNSHASRQSHHRRGSVVQQLLAGGNLKSKSTSLTRFLARPAGKHKQGNSKDKRRAVRRIAHEAEQLQRANPSSPLSGGAALLSPSANRRVRDGHRGAGTPSTPRASSLSSSHPPGVPRKQQRKRPRAHASSQSPPLPDTPTTRARAHSQPPPVKRQRRQSRKQRRRQLAAHARAVKAGVAVTADTDEQWLGADGDDDADDTAVGGGNPLRVPGTGVRHTDAIFNMICVMRFHPPSNLMATIEDSSKKWQAKRPAYQQIANLLGVGTKTVSMVCRYYDQHKLVPSPSLPRRGRRSARTTHIDDTLYGDLVKVFLAAFQALGSSPSTHGVRMFLEELPPKNELVSDDVLVQYLERCRSIQARDNGQRVAQFDDEVLVSPGPITATEQNVLRFLKRIGLQHGTLTRVVGSRASKRDVHAELGAYFHELRLNRSQEPWQGRQLTDAAGTFVFDEHGAPVWERDDDGKVINDGGNGLVVGAHDETWSDKGLHKADGWFDPKNGGDDAGTQQVSVGGSRLCMIGILTRTGWLGWTRQTYETDAAELNLMRSIDKDKVKSGGVGGVWAYGISPQYKTKDYHGNVDFTLVHEHLLFCAQRFEQPMLIIMDNATTHKVKGTDVGSRIHVRDPKTSVEQLQEWARHNAPAVYEEGMRVKDKRKVASMTFDDALVVYGPIWNQYAEAVDEDGNRTMKLIGAPRGHAKWDSLANAGTVDQVRQIAKSIDANKTKESTKTWRNAFWSKATWQRRLGPAWDAAPYVLESMLAEEGMRMFGVPNRILWLPTQMPELSAVEFGWSQVKDNIRRYRPVVLTGVVTHKRTGKQLERFTRTVFSDGGHGKHPGKEVNYGYDAEEYNVEIRLKALDFKALSTVLVPYAFLKVTPTMASNLFRHVGRREREYWDEHPERENEFNAAYAALEAQGAKMRSRSSAEDLLL